MHYLKLVGDDIFGRDNFIATVPRKTRSGRSNVPYNLSQDFDWILMYANEAVKKANIFQRTISRKYHTTPDFPDDAWRLSDITVQATIRERPNLRLHIGKSEKWTRIPSDPIAAGAFRRIHFMTTTNEEKLFFLGDYDFLNIRQPALRVSNLKKLREEGVITIRLSSHQIFSIRHGRITGKYGQQKGTDEIVELFGRKAFAYPKNELLMQRIIEYTTKEGDIVLDFHLGSGTTAAVAHKMGRQYIGIEQMDYADTLPIERLKKVIAGEQGGISEAVNWQGGGDFIYCELMRYNQAYMDKIQSAHSSEALVTLWREIAENAFLNWYVNAEMPEEAINDFIAIGDVEKQKHLLAELLDKNQLYVNLTEIEDADLGECGR